MEDVPIFIFFCTDRKQMTFLDKMLADRDNDNNSEEHEQTFNGEIKATKLDDEIEQSIEKLIQGTKHKFQAVRNIHIMQGNDQKTIIRYK